VPVLDSAARGSTTTFVQKGIGDVHLTWENEAHLEVQEAGGEAEIVYPPISILAEPAVAWVDANVSRKGTRDAAEAYLRFLYTPEGQDIIARNHYRPTTPEAVQKHQGKFPALQLVSINTIAKDWADANDKFFADGKIFDSIYQPAK
jgi:sulfate transport system substrate-binding protein